MFLCPSEVNDEFSLWGLFCSQHSVKEQESSPGAQVAPAVLSGSPGVAQPSQGCWEGGAEVPAVPWALGQALLSLLQLPEQEVKSLCVNKAQGQQMPNCQPREASARAATRN